MPEFFQPRFPDNLACVIFDIDGTLVKSNDLIFASFNHVAAKYLGRTLSQAEIIGLFGPPEEGGLSRILDDRLVPGAMDELCSFYDREHSGMASLHQGIEEILRFLSNRNVKLAVFTGKGRRTATITLEQLGISSYFGLVISGSDVDCHKPHPEGIHRILTAFGVPAGQTLMVGDSVSDIKASRAAGVAVASVLWDCYDQGSVLREKAEFRFQHVSEMMAWLHRQFGS